MDFLCQWKEQVNGDVEKMLPSRPENSCIWGISEIERELDLYFKGDKESSFHLWQWVNTALIFNR